MMGLSLDNRVAVLEHEMDSVQELVTHASARIDQILFAVLGILGSIVAGTVIVLITGAV